MLYFKKVPPLLVFGPSFWFLATLLLNPGNGSGQRTAQKCRKFGLRDVERADFIRYWRRIR